MTKSYFIVLVASIVAMAALSGTFAIAQDKLNILWITSEDHGPEMGCYGDKLANTPHVDTLAKKGMLLVNVF